MPYGQEYPEYLDEDGDWMTAFPRDRTPHQLLQETQERLRQNERTQGVIQRAQGVIENHNSNQDTISNPRFLTEYRYVVQNFIQGEWETLFETSNLQSANIILDLSQRRVRLIDRVVDGTSLPFIVIRESEAN